jgi:hypothetical protein
MPVPRHIPQGATRVGAGAETYYGSQPSPLDDVDQARAREYALLSALLRRAPNTDLLTRLAALRGGASRVAAA